MTHSLLRTTAVVVGATGATVGAAYSMLSRQGRRARRSIVIPGWRPFLADGVYLPDGTGPQPLATSDLSGLVRIAMLGDSLAAGLGAEEPDQLPGAVLARGLAQDCGRPVQLDTMAICGCTSRRLGEQVDTVLIDPPDMAVIMIGANDVTRRISPCESARLLGDAVSRLRAAGITVIVGTCPDLGTIRSIPQPLRTLAHTSSLRLARMQREEVGQSGGVTVPLAQLLSADFLARPDMLFARDHYHPSSAGYAAACAVLLPVLCSALRDGCSSTTATPPLEGLSSADQG
ncbi:MAG TPA: SGNH/GDSL hydrolase family protein [Pseudonocardiaceae bacterium]|nr:SGNH/GDSL hydrolase family protein [Pseudonocardiaceae bacterium]